VVGAENRGLTVAQMTSLRAKARAQGVYLRVVKNTLARKAVTGTPYECISPALKGPLLLAFSKDDPGAAARVLKAFAKDHDKLVTTLVSLGGQLLGPKDIEKVASLPTREQAIAQLMGLMKAPISKFVRTLAEPQAKLVRTLAAIRAQKEAAAG
jgi:large subunit ribosomal protein L10